MPKYKVGDVVEVGLNDIRCEPGSYRIIEVWTRPRLEYLGNNLDCPIRQTFREEHIIEDTKPASSWTPIKYRYDNADDVFVQWDGIIGKWRVLDSGKLIGKFDTSEAAIAWVETLTIVYEDDQGRLYATKPADKETRATLMLP